MAKTTEQKELASFFLHLRNSILSLSTFLSHSDDSFRNDLHCNALVLIQISIFSDVWSCLSRDQLPVCQVWPEQGLLLDAGLKTGLIGGFEERVCGKNR